MTARMTWLVCRKAPSWPGGVAYFAGQYRIVRGRRASAVSAVAHMLRADAWEGDETAARMIADLLTAFGPAAGVAGTPAWEAVPAAIEMAGGAHA